MSTTSADKYGAFVISVGWDGVRVNSAVWHGVCVNISEPNHGWGFYSPDKIFAGTTLASNGPLMLVAQSGDSGSLETGDLVVVSDAGLPWAKANLARPLVRRASPGNRAVMGVVYRRFVAEEKVKDV